MKKLAVLLAGTVTAAVFIALHWHPASFEERAIQLQLAHTPSDLAVALQDEPLEVKTVVLNYLDDRVLLLRAQAVLSQHPKFAHAVLPLYGDTPEFKEILAAYGESVVTAIYFFLNNDPTTVHVAPHPGQKPKPVKVVAPSARQKTRAPAFHKPPPKPTPAQRGWYAVNYIRSEGQNFLTQFVIDHNGNPKWNPTEQSLEAATTRLSKTLPPFKTKLRSDEILTPGDIAWAMTNVLAPAASVEPTEASERAAVVASRLLRWNHVDTQNAHGKWAAIGITTYVALHQPSIMSDLLASTANAFYLPARAGLIVGWSLILLLALYMSTWILRLTLRPTTALLNTLRRALAWLDRPKKKERAILDLRGSYRPLIQNDFLT